jgi:hypothetical protein
MDVDVAQERLQRIPAGPQNLKAETFELIQCAHNYHNALDKLRRQGVRFEGTRALIKQFIEFYPFRPQFKRRLSQ